ncbi:acyltransferase family protein [Brevundimonas staleyi]|uniref:Acyltransferase family protein n=1 Tax=Brevundimonas staleyi TaxID=74326 RepID=A0ABW0FLP1_9CAUL
MRFAALDGWRGLAAVMVALFHLSAAGWFHDIPAVRHGGVAVPLFFVLSGFVIHHAYGDRLKDVAAGWRFVVRRFGRLYPLHLFTLGLLVGLEGVKLVLTGAGAGAGQAAFSRTNDLPSLAVHLALAQAVVPSGDYSWNIPSWSIGAEWAACLVFAGLMLVAGLRGRAATVVAAVVFGGAMLCVDVFLPDLHTMQGRGLLLALFGFFAGGAVHQAHGALRRRGWTGGTAAELIACMVLGALFWWKPPGDFLAIVGFSGVILVFAFEGGRVSRGLKAGAVQFLGRISYSIYLVHFVLLAVLGGVLRTVQGVTGARLIEGAMIDFGPPGAMDLLAIAYLAVVILCAWATYVWIETPGRAIFNVLSERQRLWRPGQVPVS